MHMRVHYDERNIDLTETAIVYSSTRYQVRSLQAVELSLAETTPR